MMMERKLLHWLLTGEVGVSSRDIASVMAGIPVDLRWCSAPRDPSDFKRCLKLLIAVPEIRPRLPEMKYLSPRWAKLVDHWYEVECSLMSEVPGWIDGTGYHEKAPKTYKLMKDIGL